MNDIRFGMEFRVVSLAACAHQLLGDMYGRVSVSYTSAVYYPGYRPQLYIFCTAPFQSGTN